MMDLGGVLEGLGEDFGGILGHGRTSKNLWFSFRFLMILVCFGGLEGSRRAILGPMLGDVGCKMGPRWVQEGLESEFLDQLGVLMGILAPRLQDKASQDGSGVEEVGASWCDLEELEGTWVGRRRRRGPARGGGSKDPRVGL